MVKKIILLLLVAAISLMGQDAGNTGLSFLRIGSSARSIATSDIGLLDSDPSSIFYNPAAINKITT